ncbi:unnamed protein product [Acanthocheilonema viteae]|uniref:Uncharacterized protein n=1 Tax=Acanthocheilonema viteae TaxID=6277 RepID=A0A498SJD0_ACAVI|nr:unnamed protein product [Acanthocheilonema viteae]
MVENEETVEIGKNGKVNRIAIVINTSRNECTKLFDRMIKKSRVAETVVTWIAAASKNNTNNTAAVTSRAPVRHVELSSQVARITEMLPVQTSARQVGLTLTAQQQLKQEHRGIQISNNFTAHSSPFQAFTRVHEFDETEDTHFLYYIVIFGAIIVCIYVASHNKKKILGFIIEGRKPSNNIRRAAFRYRRLSQHDDSGSGLTNVIY